MTTKRAKKSGKKVKTLRAKTLSAKQTKNVKGGAQRDYNSVSTYTVTNAWPK